MSSSPQPVPASRGSYAIFRIRDYRLLTGSVFLTTLLQQTQGVALGWDIYERTGSALALGAMGLAQFLPVIILFLPAGQIADRYDRRWIMVLSLVLWCSGSLGLALAAWTKAPVGWLYLGLAASGAAMVINRPARDAMLPQIVPPALLTRALAWNSSIFQIASVGGPALAGVTIAVGGVVLVYSINCALALLALALAIALSTPSRGVTRRAISWHEIFAGLGHVWYTKILLGAMVIDLFAVLFSGATALLPIYAKDILHVGPAGLGWLSAAPALGAMATAVVQGHRHPHERSGRTFLLAITGFGLGMIVFGLSTWFWLSFAALVAAGACDIVGVVIRQAVVQLYTPDELRGRVSAVNRVFISSSNELGAFESGLLAAFTTPVFTVVFGGTVTIASVIIGAHLFPGLRRLGRLG